MIERGDRVYRTGTDQAGIVERTYERRYRQGMARVRWDDGQISATPTADLEVERIDDDDIREAVMAAYDGNPF